MVSYKGEPRYINPLPQENFHEVVCIGYKYQFAHTPYILRAKVTRAGLFPPTIATLGASAVRLQCGNVWYIVVVVVVVVVVEVVCSAGCRLVIVEVVYSAMAVDWQRSSMVASTVHLRHSCHAVDWLSAVDQLQGGLSIVDQLQGRLSIVDWLQQNGQLRQ